MPTAYYLIHFRDDITGICEAKIVAGPFGSLAEAGESIRQNTQKWVDENPYFYLLAEEKEDGHLYFLNDKQPIHLYTSI
jgi:hypothetical protein